MYQSFCHNEKYLVNNVLKKPMPKGYINPFASNYIGFAKKQLKLYVIIFYFFPYWGNKKKRKNKNEK